MRPALIALSLLVISAPVAARDSLGVFGEWAAFRDPEVPRCYAIAAMQRGSNAAATGYASVAIWPRRSVRGQVHFHLSRTLASNGIVTLTVGRQSFTLVGGGNNAWAKDAAMDAAIVSAMRSAAAMQVRARSADGRRFTDRYDLSGVATALDAATVGCARAA